MPELDARPMLTMADMGHGGMGHDMNAMGPQKPADTPASQPATPDPHAGHGAPAKPASPDPHAGHQMPPKAGAPTAPDPHAGHTMPAQQPADPHAGHNMAAMSGGPQQHPSTEDGNPLVDMQTMMPTSRLDDPGIGLRDNGRRVLTYADLKSVFEDPDGREPGRTIELHLTGHMGRFVWSFNGVKFSDAEPLRLTYGRTPPDRPGERHDDDAPHSPAWYVERHRGRRRQVPRALSTPWTCLPARNARIESLRMPWDAGRITATCSFTWKRACSAKCGWKNDENGNS